MVSEAKYKSIYGGSKYYHLEKLINMNFLQVKKYSILTKDKSNNKLSLHFPH